MKTCTICGATSDEKAFYAGVNRRCAECHRAKVKQNREEKAEYYRQYDAKRYLDDPRVKSRHRRYAATDSGKAAFQRAREKWIAQNPDKRAAHGILWRAIRAGRITKPTVCSCCGAGGRIEGHHADYSLPLVVQWLCRKCHVAAHR